MPMAGLRKGGRAEGRGAKAGRLGGDFFGLQTQCRRVRLHPPAAADRCSRLRGNIGVDGRNFQIFGKRGARSSGKPSLSANSRFLTLGGPSFATYNRLSTLGRAVAGRAQPFFNARGPRATRGARPVVMTSRNSLPALKEMTTVQVEGPYSVSRADGRVGHSGVGTCRAASRRDSLPPLSAAGVVQAEGPYSVSGADGLLRHSELL